MSTYVSEFDNWVLTIIDWIVKISEMRERERKENRQREEEKERERGA